jgi:protein-S-isoprenylcysteine O-methyltransferase Ste14
MALIHEFENSGNWLFKRRSWLPVFMIVAGVIALYLVNRQAILFDMRNELIFLGVSLFGEAIRIYTVGFAPKNTSGRNTVSGQIADELNTKGIYSLLRHPLYLGNFFMWLGPVLFIRSGFVIVVFGLIYWIYYERIMFAEEQFLRRKFGDKYDTWSAKVSSFLPLSFNYIPTDLTFSVRNVLKREYNSFINVFLIFILMDVMRNYFLSRRIYFTPMWIYLFGSALLIWLVVWILHKKTRILEVEGR